MYFVFKYHYEHVILTLKSMLILCQIKQTNKQFSQYFSNIKMI